MMFGTRKNKVLAVAVGSVLVVVLTILGLRSAENSAAVSATPPYYRQLPAYLPAVLESKRFSDPETKASYQAASANAPLLAQLPCYCHCERSHGHKSLLSCFADAHGAECSICRREALFAGSEASRGKSATQIREEIIRGLWAHEGDGAMKGGEGVAGSARLP